MQDEVRAQSLEQSLELHVFQVGIQRSCELDELPRKSHGSPAKMGSPPSCPEAPRR